MYFAKVVVLDEDLINIACWGWFPTSKMLHRNNTSLSLLTYKFYSCMHSFCGFCMEWGWQCLEGKWWNVRCTLPW